MMNKEEDENHKYAKTLNLPQTEFPMRANAVQREPKLLKDVYQLYKWQELNNKGPLWVTHDGPPYANGDLHLGHTLGKVLKDIVNRYKMMQGYRVSFIPGWDCHGLPIEMKALEKLAKEKSQQTSQNSPATPAQAQTHAHANARTLAPQELRAYAREFAHGEVAKQRATFMSWGIMGDWEQPYLTLTPQYTASQLEVFFTMFTKGYVYRGLRPVHWSPSSLTALADAELEYNEKHVSTSVYVSFKFKSLALALPENVQVSAVHALIWTTTPWTLPANVGVCLNTDITYSLVCFKNDSRYFVVAKDLAEFVAGELGLEFESVGEFAGSSFENSVCEHPFENRDSRVVFGDHVNTQAGTGLVHTAPGHGEEDFEVGKKYNLPVLSPVGPDGKFTKEAGERFQGKFVLKEECNALLKEKTVVHKYPYDWRTNKPIIVRTTPQWFVDLREVSEKAKEEVTEKVKMVPQSSHARFVSMLSSRSAWCISRQRVWGVPIPVFYDEEGEALINDETMQYVINLVKQNGTDCWWSLSVEELLPPTYRNNGVKYTKGTDTMDVWFDSGVSWHSVLHARSLSSDSSSLSSSLLPADLYLEGSDQHRGWFQSSLLTSMCATGKAPYKTVVTHGFVLDEHGHKMSKSKGNVIPPSRITHGGDNLKANPAYGVDGLRFFIASSDYTKDIVTSPIALARVSEALRNVRNRFRFILSNNFDFTQQDLVPYAELQEVDKYLLLRLYEFGKEVQDSYENFNFTNVFKLVMNFTNQELSAFYFELVKRRLYTELPSSPARRSAQTALHYVLDVSLKVLAPLLPHTTEDVYQYWPNKPYSADSVFCTGWFVLKEEWNNRSLVPVWDHLMHLREDVNKLLESVRSKKVIRRPEEADLELTLSAKLQDLFKLFSTNDLAEVFLVSNVYLVKQDAQEQQGSYVVVSKKVEVTEGEKEGEKEGEGEEVVVRARVSKSSKCARCWRYKCLSDVELCPSCSSFAM